MNQNIISAVFDDRSGAEAAVNELRSAGAETDNDALHPPLTLHSGA